MDYFRNSMGPVEECLRDIGIGKNNVLEVVLLGGSTRIPKVQSMIQEFFTDKKSLTSPSTLMRPWLSVPPFRRRS